MIKSKKVIASLVAFAAIASAQIAMATPGNISIRLDCPDIGSKGTEIVTNYGSVLTGPGIERVGTHASTFPIFSGVNPGGVPMDLVVGGYSNHSTAYNPGTGVVTCTYASSLGNPPFELTLQMQNAFNGIVTKSESDEINIKFTMGVKA